METLENINDADVLIKTPGDLAKLDMLDLERSDEILIHYNSQRKAGGEGSSLTTRRCEYRSHSADGWFGSLTVVDNGQTIELDRKKRKKGKAFLVSRGGQSAVRLGYLRGVSKPV